MSAQTAQNARLIYNLGVQHGLTPARARELVAAAFEESGLNPRINNRAGSGAAGLFQLLSSGYVQKARKLGGVYNPRANTLAILPDYVRYWQQHPNARPGEAARDVERSGQGAGFYSKDLGRFSKVGGGVAGLSPSAPAAAQAAAPDRHQLAEALIANLGADHPDVSALIPLVAAGRAAQKAGAVAGGIVRGQTPASKQSGYVEPLKGIRYQFGRTDQGLDLETGAANVGKPIRAIGNAKIVAVSRNYQGFGQYVAYQLLDGPRAGQVVYVGHSRVANVKVGQQLRAGAPVAFIQGYGASPGHLEMGFASPHDPYTTLGRSQGDVNPRSHYSRAGADFTAFYRRRLR